MAINVGILGHSPGNGHPFSYSSIINGYSDAGLREAGWPVIYDYVRRRHASDFGVEGLRVTCAWTQDAAVTQALCRAANIATAVASPSEMLGQVDAVIIARDDAASHRRLAEPFLEAGIPVFIDKPLTLDTVELDYFRPFLETGKLMSCSSMRYAWELDVIKAGIADYGQLHVLRGTIVNDWARYGVHMLDAIFPLVQARPVAIRALASRHQSLAITMDDGTLVTVDALGDAPPIFRVDVLGSRCHSQHDITDNFSMFRRLLSEFAAMVEFGRPSESAETTVWVLKTLIAGNRALQTNQEVSIDDAQLQAVV
ncbi:Gfo/Idh/MocA family oxidoreductase [Halomonas sp. HP20-15]|uniref:Gfo/Idh/MocA family oxidoreductase n=1 Tax=Halomonas sp. HP20-15 TaxID=3085901 RepID=UPI002981FDA3|nr:Gfo/Idh/MocA family oxidoreductase [Halomonas sp. HP20-15]MDW5377019.1 Gfo/Idh/MocA family oxidoreductase [Halomonas sp. HP20-15]